MKRYDHLEIRCPRLGGEVTFAYCRYEQGNLPCPRTIGCWRNHVPVEAYLREVLTPGEFASCFNELPKDRVSVIFEAVEAARKRE